MKRFGIAILIAGLLLTQTGCSAEPQIEEPDQRKVTLTVLAGQSTSDAGVEDMIDEWMEKNFPQVTLEWECVDWGDKFNSQVRGRFAAGEIPDILVGKAQDVQAYAKTGNLAVISETCREKITKEALDAVIVDGEVYGLPYNAWYQGVIYNKNIFSEYDLKPPRTKEELQQVIEVLEAHNIVPFAAHFQESWKVANMTMQYMMNDIFDETPEWGDLFRQGKVSFEDNLDVRECLENHQFILEHTWEDALQIDQFESDSRFTKGEAAMYLTGSWSMQFSKQYGKNIDFGIFPFPNRTGNAKLIRETNMTFMKSAKTEHETLIDHIFEKLTEDEKLAQEIVDFTQSVSAIKGIYATDQNKLQEDIRMYEAGGRVIDVTVGNAQLVWDFQSRLAQQQLLWLHHEETLDDVLKYADENRADSSY